MMIFACYHNNHDDEIVTKINFRIGNLTQQSQEKYFRENLIRFFLHVTTTTMTMKLFLKLILE